MTKPENWSTAAVQYKDDAVYFCVFIFLSIFCQFSSV